MRSIRNAMCSGMLGLQAVVLFLAPLAFTATSSDLSAGAAIGIGLGLAALCVVGAGMVRRPGGLALGWAIQVLTVALGFLVTAMFVLGVVFLALWAGSVRLGTRIDRERAERLALEQPAGVEEQPGG